MKTFNVTVQVDDTVPGAVTAEDVTWTVRAMRGVREVDARGVTTYNSCEPVTPFTSDVPAESCDVKPSTLESSPDAAEEWSIDARMAEMARVEREYHERGDDDDPSHGERFRSCSHSYCTQPSVPGSDRCAGHERNAR